MKKTVTYADGTPHRFEDVRYTYGDNTESCPGVLETYAFGDAQVRFLYCGEKAENVPDTEEAMDTWLNFPLPGSCFVYQADTGLYHVNHHIVL